MPKLAAFLAILALAGCGESRQRTYQVSGTVEFGDGTPVRFGSIQFVPVQGGPAARGKIDQQGRFQLGTFTASDGAIAGRHRVVIVQHPTGGQTQQPTIHEQEHDQSSGMVDVRYAQFDLTPVSVEVEPRDNQVRLRVEKSSRKR